MLVPAGNNSTVNLSTPNTTYYFQTGIHTLGTGAYNNIVPSDGDSYIGAPGAVIDGQGKNNSLFDGGASGVTVKYLTIQNFNTPNNEGAVNHDAGSNWTIEYNTIQNNGAAGGDNGAAIIGGSGEIVEYNCLYHNGQYGINAYSPNDINGMTVEYNEFSHNDPTGDSCGCAGGVKFWRSSNVVMDYNWVHDTGGGAGIWADTDNNGFQIEGNYLNNNAGEAIMYEISYNALIENNTLIDNTWANGASNPGFPQGTIYISSSGGDSRVKNAFGITTLTISGNVLTDNWGGVTLYDNADRHCGFNDSSDCTLVDPSTYTVSSCNAHDTSSATPNQTPDYFDNCRWKTQNVTVTGNTFSMTAANIPKCTPSNGCGFNSLFSGYGTVAPYQGWVVPDNIAAHQNNLFTNNTYHGPWVFDGLDQGNINTWQQWTQGFTDPSANAPFPAQDAGSTYSA